MDEIIRKALDLTIDTIDCHAFKKVSGKVRDSFLLNEEERAIVVSDRVSSFDFVLGTIPFKGAVLNQIAAFWFEKLKEIGVPTHFISTPDPNISIVKNAKVLPVEIIVRGYLTGTTKTSSWYAYQNCGQMISDIKMPDGMKKNQKFKTPIITPTTKPSIESGLHDEKISREEIISRGLVSEKIYCKAEELAMKMFTFGQDVAAKRGLILVDTKYEMGIDSQGELMVIDEVHTPDSSRYWIADSYEDLFLRGAEPEALDKEFVRKMIIAEGYDINSSENPAKYMTDEIRFQAAKKYLELFEKITGKSFQIPKELNSENRILSVLKKL
jgi:phosphoribosylaminoimidazole-succinocarboxamide synthase